MKKLYIDIGGTYIRSELHSNSKIFKEKILSAENSLSDYLENRMKTNPEISFIGISYAGQIFNNKIISAPNIVSDKKDIIKDISSRYAVHIEIDNDINCAVMAEAKKIKSKNIALLYVGTGMGAAVIDNNKIVRGERNLSYEIGHIPYKNAPFRCGCGKENCIELFGSGSAISKWLKYNKSKDSYTLQELKQSNISTEQNIAKEFESALLYAVGTLLTLANPHILILGGGVIKNNTYLVEYIKNNIDKFALNSSLKNLNIELSKIDNASLEGAKLLEKRYYG